MGLAARQHKTHASAANATKKPQKPGVAAAIAVPLRKIVPAANAIPLPPRVSAANAIPLPPRVSAANVILLPLLGARHLDVLRLDARQHKTHAFAANATKKPQKPL